MAIATDGLKILDICNFLAPGFSYSEYFKDFEVEEISNISVEQYNFAHQVWKEENMKTLKDVLIYYNNAGCKPFVLAIEK